MAAKESKDGEDIPFQPSSPDPDTQDGFWSRSVVCSKLKILLVILLFVVLLVVVIVLAILLANARARSDHGKRTPSQGPTSSPQPTTPGTEAWWNLRLPRDIRPIHYNIFLNITVDLPRYHGHVEIYLNVTRPSDVILLHADSLNVSHVKIEGMNMKGDLAIKDQFVFKKNTFYVIQMTSPLHPGQYIVKMTFAALFSPDLRGLYRSTYKKPDGKIVNFAATQFQPLRARRAFPCLEEPAFKATFNITIAHSSKYIALSNMPIYKSQTIDGQTYDYFEKTPIMSTYLVAFVVGIFDYREVITANGVKMRIYSRPSLVYQSRYGASQGSQLMTFFERYFNIKYTLPKADMIAIPDFAAGAMENWGLITYREKYLLWDPITASEKSKDLVTAIIAHELAHMWFGNIATMMWWDDLWLNEGFANIMQNKIAVDAVQPSWGKGNQFILSSYERGILLDGLVSSHPIKVPVSTRDEISSIFDAISYSKGGSVLRMLESFLSNETFVRGLTRYLNKHAFSNAVTDDLWSALSEESCIQTPCVDVKYVMDTWTLQMGYPVVKVTRQDSSTYVVTQKRFLFDPKANITDSKYKSPFNYTWVIPFTYITNTNPNKQLRWMNRSSISIKDDKSTWIKGNTGYYGFYLVNYDAKSWDALINQLKADHKVFSESDRASLIFDAFILARGGQLNYSKAFDVTSYIKSETDYVPWKVLVKRLNYIKQVLSPTSLTYKNLIKYLLYQAEDLYVSLGFQDSGSHLDIYKRDFLLDIFCEASVRSCIDNATIQFKDWMKNPSQNRVAPNLRSIVYYYGVANGGVAEWEFVYNQYQTAGSPSEEMDLRNALAAAKEPWILVRYLQYSMDPNRFKVSVIRFIVDGVAGTAQGNQIAWDFVRLNWNKLVKTYGNPYRAYGRLVPGIAMYFKTEFQLDELIKFNREILQTYGEESSKMRQTVEEVKSNIKWLKDNQKTIDNWLKGFIAKHNI